MSAPTASKLAATPAATSSRPYDVVLLGCGFFGKLTLRRLLEALQGTEHRVAIAGRHREKLRAALAEVGAPEGRVGIISPADASSLESMRALAWSTRVILVCLPNYKAVGDTVVRACAEESTHYFDLSVETDLHREWRELHGATAAASGAIIAPSCGYDYAVADFGALEVARRLPLSSAAPLTIECYMTVKPGPSGVVMRESTFIDLMSPKPRPTPSKHSGIQATQKRALTPSASTGPTTATTLLERLRRGLPVQYNRSLGVFSLPGPRSMADVVHASRDLAWGAGSGPGKAMPVEFTSRIVVSSLSMAALCVVGIFLMLPIQLPPVRWALARVAPPLLRRMGVLTRDESRYLKTLQQTSVRKDFVAVTSGAGGTMPAGTGRRMLSITANGLDVTPMGLALAAVVALDEAGRLGPAGVTTPAVAFQGTSYWPRLVEWSEMVVSTEEEQKAAANGHVAAAKEE